MTVEAKRLKVDQSQMTEESSIPEHLDTDIYRKRQKIQDELQPYAERYLREGSESFGEIGVLPDDVKAVVIDSAIHAAAFLLTDSKRKSTEQGTRTKWRKLDHPDQVDPIQLGYENNLRAIGVGAQDAVRLIPTIMEAGSALYVGYKLGDFAPRTKR